MKVHGEGLEKKGLTIKQLTIGQTYKENFVITGEMIESFARVTGDFNPIHLDEAYARETVFGTRVAQGMLQAGLLSGVLGTSFPGVGTIYFSQSLKFQRPVLIGDKITLCIEVLEIIHEKKRVRLGTVFTNQKGETVVAGEAVVMPP